MDNRSIYLMVSTVILAAFFVYPAILPNYNFVSCHIPYRYLIASHTTDYQHPMLSLNTVAVGVLVVAKLPNMHKVRIFGINAGN
jgi:hypothetical protein